MKKGRPFYLQKKKSLRQDWSHAMLAGKYGRTWSALSIFCQEKTTGTF